jgi:hypothetical protein
VLPGARQSRACWWVEQSELEQAVFEAESQAKAAEGGQSAGTVESQKLTQRATVATAGEPSSKQF